MVGCAKPLLAIAVLVVSPRPRKPPTPQLHRPRRPSPLSRNPLNRSQPNRSQLRRSRASHC